MQTLRLSVMDTFCTSSETELRVMKLIDGKIPTLWDDSLDLQHILTTFIVSRTRTSFLQSGEKPATGFEGDLVEQPRVQPPKARIMSIGEEANFSTNTIISSASDSVLSLIPAQCASVVCSDRLGLKVNNPFVDQSTLRSVVSSIKLYPIEPVE